jgi:hypothetical protein
VAARQTPFDNESFESFVPVFEIIKEILVDSGVIHSGNAIGGAKETSDAGM